MGDQGRLKERVTHSAKQAKGLMTLGYTSLSLSFSCVGGWKQLWEGAQKRIQYSILGGQRANIPTQPEWWDELVV